MKFSGFSFRIGKRTRLHFSRGRRKSGSGSNAWLIIRIFLGLIFAYGFISEFGKDWLNCAIGLIGFLILWGRLIFGIIAAFLPEKKKKQRKNELSRTCSFILETDPAPEMQERLKRLKIKCTAGGLSAKASVEANENGARFLIGGEPMGSFAAEDAAWINGHIENIGNIEHLHVYGGGHDAEDNPRLFFLRVWLELKRPCIAPQTDVPELAPGKYDEYDVKGDEVVYVSQTKKIHKGTFNCGINTGACKPMLYEEAIEAGCTLCARCYK